MTTMKAHSTSYTDAEWKLITAQAAAKKMTTRQFVLWMIDQVGKPAPPPQPPVEPAPAPEPPVEPAPPPTPVAQHQLPQPLGR